MRGTGTIRHDAGAFRWGGPWPGPDVFPAGPRGIVFGSSANLMLHVPLAALHPYTGRRTV